MGHKVNPVSFRLAIKGSLVDWQSQWFAGSKDYKKFLVEDWEVRRFLDKKLEQAGLVSVRIERLRNEMRITLQVSRPGMVIGRGGKGLEDLKRELLAVVDVKKYGKNLDIDVEEVKNAALSAKLVAKRISYQLVKRMPYRRAVNKAMEETMSAGAVGIKVILGGRINGAEISRREKFAKGKVSLSSLRSFVDYADEPSLTRSGYIGVKVYINRGELS